MTTEELLKLVRSIADEDKADPIFGEFVVLTIDELMKLCNAVAAKEREACAKLVENIYYGLRIQPTRSECADAIRGRNTND